MRRLTVAAALAAGLAMLAGAAAPAAARPSAAVRGRAAKPAKPAKPAAARPSQHDGAHARVAINRLGDLRPAREAVGRREEPLTPEEETARQIEKLLRGPLRYGVTGLFVADARTGDALFAVNADDPLNPASNVKMISTAAALELLGPDFRYPTRLFGATPDRGIVHGDVYLLGSYDPTLTASDLTQLAAAIAARGVTRIDGDIIVGPDPSRDGLPYATLEIDVRAGEPGGPVIASVPAGMEPVVLTVTARTARAPGRARLGYQVQTTTDAAGHTRLAVAISGTIGKGGATRGTAVLRERTAAAAYTLRAALRARGVAMAGELKTAELSAFITSSVAAGALPVELARHESARLAEIVARINKWSINWLADRVIMTAAALVKREPPSMELALAAMYDWLGRHPGIAKSDLLVDSGSGLSYHTRITAHELVAIVRSAAGFVAGSDAGQSRAWLDSLSVAGTDGTLAGRFRGGDLRGRIRAKTGTLSTVIALSGLLEVDPQRPLAFALVTNGDTPLSHRQIRRAHEQVVGVLSRYLTRTHKAGEPTAAPPEPAAAPAAESDLDEIEIEIEPAPDPAIDPAHDPAIDPVLDAETAPPP